ASPVGAQATTWRGEDLTAWIIGMIGQGRGAADTSRGGFAFAADIDVPTLVARQTSTHGWVSGVRDGSVFAKEAWALPEGSPDTGQIEEAYRAGYSLVLRRLHLRVRAITGLAHRLDAALWTAGHLPRRAVRSNLFASPAGAKGLALHHDDHDVAVLQ